MVWMDWEWLVGGGGRVWALFRTVIGAWERARENDVLLDTGGRVFLLFLFFIVGFWLGGSFAGGGRGVGGQAGGGRGVGGQAGGGGVGGCRSLEDGALISVLL